MDLQAILKRVQGARAALTTRQLVTLGVSFVAVIALVIGSAYWISAPSYGLLFSDMEAEDAARVVARLKTQKVPYRLDDSGRAVRVPEGRLDELRLDFAGGGLPASGRIGFEIFDRTAFGVTEFLEQVNYRRALEGEIARTIATIDEVSAARVHIAMAKESLFGSQERPAKASVVLKLHNSNRPLPESTVRGIVSLVAASIEGLNPDSVVVLDTFGRPLAKGGDADSSLGNLQLERQQRIEAELASRVLFLLEPVVGPGRVRVNASVRLRGESEEQTEERFDPTAILRSRQYTSEGTIAAAGTPGIAGARANLPPSPSEPAPAATLASAQAPAGTTRSSETANYELNKVVRHTVRPPGDIGRLSVAVLVDHDQVTTRGKDGSVTKAAKARDAATMQKIHDIVAAAVGFDAARGDQLTVENIPFDDSEADDAPPAPTILQRMAPYGDDALRVLVVLVLGALALLFVVRPLVSRVFPPPLTADHVAVESLKEAPRTVEELQGEIEAQLQAAESAAPRRLTALAKRLGTIAQKEPETTARLLRTWLQEEEQ